MAAATAGDDDAIEVSDHPLDSAARQGTERGHEPRTITPSSRPTGLPRKVRESPVRRGRINLTGDCFWGATDALGLDGFRRLRGGRSTLAKAA